MTDRVLPDGLSAGRSTPMFSAETTPPALRSSHHTTVWAELIVERGAVVFIEEDPHWNRRVERGETQVIVPNRKHHVEPEADTMFRVQFYDGPAPLDRPDQKPETVGNPAPGPIDHVR